MGISARKGYREAAIDLLGGGEPMPAPYEPEVRQSDILDEFIEARKRAADVHTLDRDGISTVIEYCHTHRKDRPRVVLPKTLDKDVLVALRTMDDKALRALATSGVGRIRKFLAGKEHDIFGVPTLGKTKPEPIRQPSVGLTEHERMMWKIKARLERAHDDEHFAVRKP